VVWARRLLSQATRTLRARQILPALVAVSLLVPALASIAVADSAPVAGAFVYPVGDDLDYTKGRGGEAGFHVSDEYLVARAASKRRKARIHLGVDLSNGRGGAEVHSIACGVVVVAEANGLIKYKKQQRVKVPKVVKGKRVYVTAYRNRTGYKWRTGWGNYVVVRHTLPNGQVIHSLYGHLAPRSVIVKRGDIVAAGQPLGKVGHTGRASSSHLHLEVRKALPVEGIESDEVDASAEDEPTVEERTFAKIPTVDPLAFLETHVRHFEDLDPGTWQARYAFAAVRDGLIPVDADKFQPDAAISRADYFRALVSAFSLGTPFTKTNFNSSVDALVDSGILDAATRRAYNAGDAMKRDEAVEILLRCLDRGSARARTLGTIKPDALALDFNREFAGDEAARKALAEARASSEADYRARVKRASVERARLAKAAKVARAKGKTTRVKVAAVKRLPFVPPLDAGFEALAKSTDRLTRAESCLLFASALRINAQKISALQKAASRVPTNGTPPAKAG
jgi:hypothetical protein